MVGVVDAVVVAVVDGVSEVVVDAVAAKVLSIATSLMNLLTDLCDSGCLGEGVSLLGLRLDRRGSQGCADGRRRCRWRNRRYRRKSDLKGCPACHRKCVRLGGYWAFGR